MDFEEVIRKRFACRKFSSKEVEKDKLDKVLEAGRISPTAKNLQPELIYVVSSSEGLEKIDKVSPCRYGAPVVLMVCANKNEAWSNGDFNSYVMDASIVGTQMMLECTNLGLASVWVRYLDTELAKKEFNLDEGVEPVFILPIGYNDENMNTSVNHNNRKSIDEITRYV